MSLFIILVKDKDKDTEQEKYIESQTNLDALDKNVRSSIEQLIKSQYENIGLDGDKNVCFNFLDKFYFLKINVKETGGVETVKIPSLKIEYSGQLNLEKKEQIRATLDNYGDYYVIDISENPISLKKIVLGIEVNSHFRDYTKSVETEIHESGKSFIENIFLKDDNCQITFEEIQNDGQNRADVTVRKNGRTKNFEIQYSNISLEDYETRNQNPVKNIWIPAFESMILSIGHNKKVIHSMKNNGMKGYNNIGGKFKSSHFVNTNSIFSHLPKEDNTLYFYSHSTDFYKEEKTDNSSTRHKITRCEKPCLYKVNYAPMFKYNEKGEKIPTVKNRTKICQEYEKYKKYCYINLEGPFYPEDFVINDDLTFVHRKTEFTDIEQELDKSLKEIERNLVDVVSKTKKLEDEKTKLEKSISSDEVEIKNTISDIMDYNDFLELSDEEINTKLAKLIEENLVTENSKKNKLIELTLNLKTLQDECTSVQRELHEQENKQIELEKEIKECFRRVLSGSNISGKYFYLEYSLCEISEIKDFFNKYNNYKPKFLEKIFRYIYKTSGIKSLKICKKYKDVFTSYFTKLEECKIDIEKSKKDIVLKKKSETELEKTIDKIRKINLDFSDKITKATKLKEDFNKLKEKMNCIQNNNEILNKMKEKIEGEKDNRKNMENCLNKWNEIKTKLKEYLDSYWIPYTAKDDLLAHLFKGEKIITYPNSTKIIYFNQSGEMSEKINPDKKEELEKIKFIRKP